MPSRRRPPGRRMLGVLGTRRRPPGRRMLGVLGTRRRRSRTRAASCARALSPGEALALGVLQGPTELLPVSSSAHTALVPWLAGWRYAELDARLRKSFEVALHVGAGAALALDMRMELLEATRTLSARRAAVVALSLAPPVLAGYALERPIERRLGGPGSIAAGLVAGAAAMALADLRPAAGGRRAERDAGACDGLALGLAQTAALVPGVSRTGATLTAARARGFAREDARTLSRHAALPVIVGAGALKGWRLAREGLPGGAGRALGVGAGSAFISTAASARLLRSPRTRAGGLLPYCLYRCAIAAIMVMRLLRTHNMSG
jgi:undecaprenyl-diphosphatase